MNKNVWIGVFLVVLVLLGIGAYYVNDLRHISITSYTPTGIGGLSLEEFTIKGELGLHNPSVFTVPVNYVNYTARLDHTGEVMTTGNLDSFVLEAKSTTTAPMDITINWEPTASFVLELIEKEKVYVVLEGKAEIDIWGLTTYTLPFSQRIDIKEYLLEQGKELAIEKGKAFVREQLPGLISALI